MDPDALLAFLREQAANVTMWLERSDLYPDNPELDAEVVFVLRFRELDEWLTKGGFLPRDWQTVADVAADVIEDEIVPLPPLYVPGTDYAIGDDDPSDHTAAPDQVCPSQIGHGQFRCTLPRMHHGSHASGDGNVVTMVWL